MPRPRPYTDAQLLQAAAGAATLREIARRLSLAPGGRTYEGLRAALLRLGITDSRFHTRREHGRTWTDEELTVAVAASRSINQVLKHLGLRPGGSVYPAMRGEFARLGLDTSHFTGQRWAKGHRFPGRRARPLEEILVKGSGHTSSHHLKRRLVAAALLDERCAVCGLERWNGRPAPLQLDHVNGDRCDNRIENLRLLCPNCHAQTPTWCGRNIGRS